VAGLTLAAALAACSSSSGSASAAGSSPVGSGSAGSSSAAVASPSSTSQAHGGAKAAALRIAGLITFKGTLRLRGAAAQHVSFSAFPGVTSPASSCARIAVRGTPAARGEQPRFEIPSPAAGSPTYFTAEVSPYRGAGTYGKASILAVGASIIVGSASYNPLAAQATASVTIRADGSGRFTFTNAAESDPAKPALSGSVSWTCSG
jgi:hypothetical protein